MLPNNLMHYHLVTKFVSGSTQSTFKLEGEGLVPLVIKSGTHPDHIKIEILCTKILEILGVGVPKCDVYSDLPPHIESQIKIATQDVYKVSEFIVSNTKHLLTSRRESTSEKKAVAYQAIVSAARQSFIANALIGNIDVTSIDNWIYAKNGQAYLIDVGSNIIFRACGELRSNPIDDLTEISSMRDTSLNINGCYWFKDISDTEIRDQVIAVLDKTYLIESVIWCFVEKLKLPHELFQAFINGIISRLDILAERYCPERRKISILDRAATPGKSSAHLIVYANYCTKPHFLLAQTSNLNEYKAFGAVSGHADELLLDTAFRCGNNQLPLSIEITKNKLLKSIYHDYVDQDNHLHRCYFMQTDSHFIANNASWIPVIDILELTEIGSSAADKVKISDDHSVHLDPDLLTVLRHVSVRKLLGKIVNGQPIYSGSTASGALNRSQGVENSSRSLAASFSQSSSSTVSLAKAIASPQVIKWDLATTLLKHSQVISEFKTNISSALLPGKLLPSIRSSVQNKATSLSTVLSTSSVIVETEYQQPNIVLAQSEIHMRAWLGNRFKLDDMNSNILEMLKIQPDTSGFSCGDQYIDNEKLIPHLVNLLRNEKDDPNQFYLYHGCNASIAFVYMIYSMLYQHINADSALAIFRANKEVFCENIQTFISHYSTHMASDGTCYISDHDEGYHDQMISTNIFLFGSEQDLFEGSLQFFRHDYAVRPVDIKRLLASFMLPLGMTTRQIDRLVELYPLFQRCHGSALYQIAISPHDVSNHVYPARKLGSVYNPHQDSDLLATLHRYRAECLSNSFDLATTKVIKSLQARLFASPDLKLTCNVITYADVMLNSQQANPALLLLKQTLKQTITDLLHDMLSSNRREFPIVSNHAVLFRQHQLIRKHYYLPLVEGLPLETQLVKAILTNSEKVVLHLLMKYPEIKRVPITYEHPRYLAGSENLSIDGLTPIEIILYHSNLAPAILPVMYGARWWDDDRLFLLAGAKKIYQILEFVEINFRLPFLQLDTIKNKVNDVSGILNIIDKLSRQDKLQFLETHLPVRDGFNWYYHAINHLESDDINTFSLKYADFIKNGKDLSFILQRLGDASKIQLLTLCRHVITTPECFDSIVVQLPPMFVSQFVLQFSHLITLPRMLCSITKSLPVEQRFEFIKNHARDLLTVKNHYEILFLYVGIQDSESRQRYLGLFQLVRIKDLYAVLNQYIYNAKPMDYLEFALSYRHLITSEAIFNEIKHKLKGDAVNVFEALRRELLDVSECGVESSQLNSGRVRSIG